MDILNKPISTLSFDEIAKFCQQKYIEGIQLDYKRELPPKGLAKHFAAFSNTRGGLIIIGVEEDKEIGTPTNWEGIINEGKLVDKVHQYASDVEPVPSYEVHVTDEKEGKVFILVRIFEGDRTPYYVQNDSNLWVRTGNISCPVDIASPDYTEILFGKKNKAELARATYIDRAYQIYEAALSRAEKERLRLITEEKNEFEKKQQEIKETGTATFKVSSKYFKGQLGTSVSMFTLIAQPFYPGRALITPLDLLDSLDQIRVQTHTSQEFPPLNMEPIQDGLLNFDWNHNSGGIECGQLYSNGFIFRSIDVLRLNDQKDPHVYISHIANLLMTFLKSLGNFHRRTGFQGGIMGLLLLRDVADVWMNKIQPSRWNVWEDKKSLLPVYKWNLELDTSIINNELSLQEYFLNILKEIYWSFGYKPADDKLYRDFLKESNWLIE